MTCSGSWIETQKEQNTLSALQTSNSALSDATSPEMGKSVTFIVLVTLKGKNIFGDGKLSPKTFFISAGTLKTALLRVSIVAIQEQNPCSYFYAQILFSQDLQTLGSNILGEDMWHSNKCFITAFSLSAGPRQKKSEMLVKAKHF